MNNSSKKQLRGRKRGRIRAKIFGTDKRPRLSVFRGLKNMYIQIIDDNKNKTLASVSTKEVKSKNNIEGAKKIGSLIAKKCQELKIKEIVFDRGGCRYHGRIKALADEARKNGLKF